MGDLAQGPASDQEHSYALPEAVRDQVEAGQELQRKRLRARAGRRGLRALRSSPRSGGDRGQLRRPDVRPSLSDPFFGYSKRNPKPSNVYNDLVVSNRVLVSDCISKPRQVSFSDIDTEPQFETIKFLKT